MSGSKRLRIVTISAASVVAAVIAMTTTLNAVPAGSAGAISLSGATSQAGPVRPASAPTGIAAAEGELCDATTTMASIGGPCNTGTTSTALWALKQTGPREIASITKVMVAYVVLKSGANLNQWIKITAAEANWGGPGVAKAGLHAGERFMVKQLLFAMLLPSGADAAAALADTYGPGQAAFLSKMNAAARALGLTATHFHDIVGLTRDMSNPQNLLTLGQKAMGLPFFAIVVKTKRYTLKALAGHLAHTWLNRNLLLSSYGGYVIGIKTGWTPAAGETLLFMANYNGRLLIGVVLDSSSLNNGLTFRDATKLLNWAYGLNIASPVAQLRPMGPD